MVKVLVGFKDGREIRLDMEEKDFVAFLLRLNTSRGIVIGKDFAVDVSQVLYVKETD